MAGARVNCYELGKHKPDLLTGRKLAEVLKVPMAFFHSDTDDVVAELLLRYGQASRAVRKRVSEVLKRYGVRVVWKAACDPIAAVRFLLAYVCDAAVAVARSCNASLRSPSHTGLPSIHTADSPMTGFRCESTPVVRPIGKIRMPRGLAWVNTINQPLM